MIKIGDLKISDAPFVITIPDDWVIESVQDDVINVRTPDQYSGSSIYYRLMSESSLDQINDYDYLSNKGLNSLASPGLNGMECKIFVGKEHVEMNAPEDDVAYIFVENQNKVLRTKVSTFAGSTELQGFQGVYSIVTSGLYPTKDSKTVPSSTPSRKAPSVKQTPSRPPGVKPRVTTPRRDTFGKRPSKGRTQDKLNFCIKKLREISRVLKRDMKYADYAAQLIRIHRILSTMVNPA